MKPRVSLDLAGIAEFLKSGACKSVYVLTGAGASTGAGIPDFRSPGGMYDTLRPELITATESQRQRMRMDPTNVVMKDMFFQNQFPYLEVRRPFILGIQQQQWKATLSHWFIKFLEEEALLKRVFTQNIDGLDYQTGISPALVTNVHGSLAQVSCEGCGHAMSFDDFCAKVRTNVKDIYKTDPTAPSESSNINCPRCNHALVKPNTVLFGGSLPTEPLVIDIRIACAWVTLSCSLIFAPIFTVAEAKVLRTKCRFAASRPSHSCGHIFGCLTSQLRCDEGAQRLSQAHCEQRAGWSRFGSSIRQRCHARHLVR